MGGVACWKNGELKNGRNNFVGFQSATPCMENTASLGFHPAIEPCQGPVTCIQASASPDAVRVLLNAMASASKVEEAKPWSKDSAPEAIDSNDH